MLEQNIEKSRDEVLVTLQGKLYMEDAVMLREQLLQLFDEGSRVFIMNVKGLDNMDTTGLGIFISLFKRTRALGGDVIIQGAGGSVRQLFALTGMDQVFTLQDSR